MENSTKGLSKACGRNKWQYSQLNPDQVLGSGDGGGSLSGIILLYWRIQYSALPERGKKRDEEAWTLPRRLGCKGKCRINTWRITSRHPLPWAAKESLSLKSGHMALLSHWLRSKYACFPQAITSCTAVGRKTLLISQTLDEVQGGILTG